MGRVALSLEDGLHEPSYPVSLELRKDQLRDLVPGNLLKISNCLFCFRTRFLTEASRAGRCRRALPPLGSHRPYPLLGVVALDLADRHEGTERVQQPTARAGP